ncbi:MAG TPA: hypothetical protein VFY29_06975 [Terriglobia bacterium]|nr:hypothetical protein [Terriglobia bacterium]
MQFRALGSAVVFLAILGAVPNGWAQSTLNFPRITQGEGFGSQIAVTNPSPYYADVQFSFYQEDGSLVRAEVVNPVRYQIPPRGQLALSSSVLFGGGKASGWVQATSLTSGLYGEYSAGDFKNVLASSETAIALTTQIIPYIPDADSGSATIIVTNPGTRNATPTISFYDSRGNDVRGPDRPTLGPREQWSTPAPRGAVWARVTSPSGVVASEFATVGDARLLINGSGAADGDTVRVAPHFVTEGTYRSTIGLVNPNGAGTMVTVSLYDRGRSEPVNRQTFEVPANGTRQLRLADLWPGPFRSIRAGWVVVESDGAPLAGLVLFESGTGLTASPLQAAPMDRLLFSQVINNDSIYTGIALANAGSRPATVELTLSSADGTTVAQQTLSLGPNEKMAQRLGELGLAPDNTVLEPGAAFLTVRSTAPIYGLEVLGTRDGARFLSVEPVVPFGPTFVPNPVVARPSIQKVDPQDEIRPGGALQIFAENLGIDTVAFVGNRAVAPRPGPDGSIMIDVPLQTEPGYVSLKLRSGGRSSTPQLIRIASMNGLQLTGTMEGRVFYQKFDVTDSGLDLSRPTYVPVRNAAIEVYDPVMEFVTSVSQTDELGRFKVAVPAKANLTVRVISHRSDSDIVVLDNTSGNAPYAIQSENVSALDPGAFISMVETGRRAGAFNILEQIQRANDLVGLADFRWIAPGVTIYWSSRNTNRSGNARDGYVGTTRFNPASGTAYVLGDRATDSDEFDDAVILHEYAHMLAARFSSDDSPGGAHGSGDVEDPRLAWSEGLANFISSAVRNDSVYRDSRGANGGSVYRTDLEENVPAGDVPGYWSETSIGSLLWDLFDDRPDAGDTIQVPFAAIWTALVDLRSTRFVYLPLFLDRFVDRNPGAIDATRSLAALRRIDYRSGADPSVADPFPRPIPGNDPVFGEVDSLTLRKANLMQAAHFFWFNSAGGPATIRLDIVGLGPAGTADANDLDLFLYDANGKEIAHSSTGGNGQPEIIRSVPLTAGSYVIEVRSSYKNGKTGAMVYNSGRYRLSISR